MNPIVQAAMVTELAALAREEPFPWYRGSDPSGTLGTDLYCVDDFAPNLRVTRSDLEVVVQTVYHAITTDELPAIDADERNWGTDARLLLMRPTTPAELSASAATLRDAILGCEIVADAEVTVSAVDALLESLEIRIRVTPADPRTSQFALVVTVQQAAVKLAGVNV